MTKKSVTNFLIPEHTKLSPEEVQDLLTQFSINRENLPKIDMKDPALSINNLEVEEGDVIRVTRKSFAGEKPYYRLVVA